MMTLYKRFLPKISHHRWFFLIMKKVILQMKIPRI